MRRLLVLPAALFLLLFAAGCELLPRDPLADLAAPPPLPQPRTSWADLGMQLLADDRPEQAHDAFIRSLRVEGVTAAALTGAGVAAERQGMLTEAQRLFGQASLRAPGSAMVQNNLGAVLYQLGEFYAARRAFQAALALSHGDERARRAQPRHQRGRHPPRRGFPGGPVSGPKPARIAEAGRGALSSDSRTRVSGERMRAHGQLAALVAALPIVLGGCQGGVASKPDPLAGNIIDDAELADLLLTAGDPQESVEYFSKALEKEPDRADFRRGLALSLARAKRYPEAARVYSELVARGQAEPSDRLEYAMVAARLDQWDDVRTIVVSLPPGMNSERRYMIDAMLADHQQNWAAADAAYARAQAVAANPADVLNNWGVSQMSRGALPEAVKMFERALSYDSRLFSAKNNLTITRGLQGDLQPAGRADDRDREGDPSEQSWRDRAAHRPAGGRQGAFRRRDRGASPALRRRGQPACRAGVGRRTEGLVIAPPALWFAILALLPLMALTAWFDLKHLRIPNALALAVLAVFLVAGLWGLPLETFLWRLGAAALVLAAGFALFAAGLIGGGDAKMAAALAPFVAAEDVATLLVLYAVVTLVLLVVLRLAMQLARRSETGWRAVDQYARPPRERVFPMGLIFAITIAVYLLAEALAGA